MSQKHTSGTTGNAQVWVVSFGESLALRCNALLKVRKHSRLFTGILDAHQCANSHIQCFTGSIRSRSLLSHACMVEEAPLVGGHALRANLPIETDLRKRASPLAPAAHWRR
jgi:hypothetical protein